MVASNCTTIFESLATSRALASGALEEMVKVTGPLADAGIGEANNVMDNTKESRIGKSGRLERTLVFLPGSSGAIFIQRIFTTLL